jgi:hypothetical protein
MNHTSHRASVIAQWRDAPYFKAAGPTEFLGIGVATAGVQKDVRRATPAGTFNGCLNQRTTNAVAPVHRVYHHVVNPRSQTDQRRDEREDQETADHSPAFGD